MKFLDGFKARWPLLRRTSTDDGPKRDQHTHPLRETWFKKYLTGNELLPQRPFGISACLVPELLADPNLCWKEFSHSRLSVDQLRRLNIAFNALHQKYGIPTRVFMPGMEDFFAAHPEIKRIESDGLHNFWSRVRLGLTGKMFAYVQNQPSEYVPGSFDLETANNLIQKFLDGNHQKERAGLSSVLEESATLLTSDGIKKIISDYKAGFKPLYEGGRGEEKKNLWEGIQKEVKAYLLANLRKKFPDFSFAELERIYNIFK